MKFVVTKFATVYEARLFGSGTVGRGKSEDEAIGALVGLLAAAQGNGWSIERRGMEDAHE